MKAKSAAFFAAALGLLACSSENDEQLQADDITLLAASQYFTEGSPAADNPACDELPEWQAGMPYAPGDQVHHGATIYTCRSAAANEWCSQAAYEPGESLHWEQAWIKEGGCQSDEPDTFCEELEGWTEQPYASGDRVLFEGSVLECKGYPSTSWCGQAAYQPGGALQEEAWNVVGDCVPLTNGNIQVSVGMLVFRDEEIFQSYLKKIQWDLEHEQNFHRKLEEMLGFVSLKSSIEDEVERLDAEDNLFIENDPDYNHFIVEDDVRAVVNEGTEYRIGPSIAKFLDEKTQVIIVDGDLATLERLRAGDLTVLSQPNIELARQANDEQVDLPVEVSQGANSLIRSDKFATDHIKTRTTISAGKWTHSGDPFETRSLVSFPLSGLPEGFAVATARMNLRADTVTPLYGQGIFNAEKPGHSTLSGPNDFTIRRVLGPWNPDAVTWITQPGVTDRHAASLPSSTSHDQNYLDIDVTQMVRDAVARGQGEVSFQLALDDPRHFRAVQFAGLGHPDSSLKAELSFELRPAGACKIDILTAEGNPPGTLDYFLSSTVSGTSGTVQYEWQINDDFPFDGNPAEFLTFDSFGQHEVCLSIKDSASCQAKKCIPVAVNEANCSVQVSAFDKGNRKFNFHAVSSGFNSPVFTYVWDIVDETTFSAGASPSYTFAKDGPYKVCATATDPTNGCTDFDCVDITVQTEKCYIRCKEKGGKKDAGVTAQSGNRGIAVKYKFRNNFAFGFPANRSEVTGVVHHYRIKNNGKWRKTRANELYIEFVGHRRVFLANTCEQEIQIVESNFDVPNCGQVGSFCRKYNKRRSRYSRRFPNYMAIVGNELGWRFGAEDAGEIIDKTFLMDPNDDNCKSNQ